MKKNNQYFIKYGALFLIPLLIDRLTKTLALNGVLQNYNNKFVSFDLLINRGISWGFFHSKYDNVFFMVSAIVSLIIILLLIHMWYRIKQGHSIFGETLILSGAVSNLIDRIMYSGVIDFIVLWIGTWSWPAFNLADAFIVVGSIYMLIYNFE